MSETNHQQQIRNLKRQVETLQHSERLYRQLIEESACGVLVADAQANCLEVNRVTYEMLGYTRDELIGRNVTELVVAGDQTANPPGQDGPRTVRVLQGQQRMCHKDGSAIWVEASARLLPDGRTIAILRDITERRRMEAVMQASLTLTASLDLRQVLDAILDAVLRLVPAEDTHIFLYRADRLSFGAAMARAGRLDRPATEIRSEGLTYTVARTSRPIAIEHPGQNPFPGGAPPNRPGAIVGLPMMIGATVVGVMNVYYPAPRRIPEAEIHVLSLLSAQAAIAVENARLYEETQRRVNELATLFQSSQAMSATLDLPTVLRQVVEQMAVAVDATSSYLLACDMKSRTATAQAEYFSPQANDLERVSDLGAEYDLTTMPHILQALREGRAAITRISDSQADPAARAELEKYGSKSGLSVPLITSGQARGYAVLWDSRDERMWSEAEVRLCQTLANLAAVAIENAQLHDTIRRHSIELEQRVAERTIELERERSRLQAILDSAGEGVEIQDRDGKILYINPAGERITGYSAAELIGQAPRHILRTEHTPP
ncbi:MAG TPA: PAS domain S-box protein, partial [Anaerolineae bacterium]|nr:PAS domain S-box protein [Anaerolineae bacterium]